MNSPTSLAALQPAFTERRDCRMCGGRLEAICRFGSLALTSSFPHFGEDVPSIPLNFMRCKHCNLMQLEQTTDPWLMYRKGYGYKSGVNESMVRHLQDVVRQAARSLPRLVLDIGCNDGTLLKAWGDNVKRVGYDPIAADVEGAEIHREYWKPDGREYSVITTLSMLYDIERPHEFASGIAKSLAPDGIWICEVGYVGAVEEGMWDAICHEHLTYYGLKQLYQLAESVDLHILDFEFNAVNGGSVLVTFGKSASPKNVSERLSEVIWREEAWDWWMFAKRVDMASKNIRKFCAGKRVYALGASTKGNTLLQMAHLGTLECAIDRNPEKWGRFTPGTGLPIRSEEWARENPPTHYLVLPYHFREGLLARHAADRARGVKFIFPLPTLEVV